MYTPMGWLVKYRRDNEDGSITSFHDREFDKKWKAKWYIRMRKKKHPDPREHYELVDCTWN